MTLNHDVYTSKKVLAQPLVPCLGDRSSMSMVFGFTIGSCITSEQSLDLLLSNAARNSLWQPEVP